MDIKPFVSPDINIFTATSPLWIIVLVVSSLAIVSSFYFKKLPDILGVFLLVFGIFGLGLGGPLTIAQSATNAKNEAYAEHLKTFKIDLEAHGFAIISGTPNLKPNTQSSMLLEYASSLDKKTYDCTLFTPEDVTRDIVFSCGEAKLSLDELTKIVEGK